MTIGTEAKMPPKSEIAIYYRPKTRETELREMRLP